MIRYAQVVVYDTPLDMDFTYIIPEEFSHLVEEGQVVVVSLRNTDKIAFVTEVSETPYPDAKPIKRVLDIRLPKALLKTTHKLSLFYLASWSKFLKETIPFELLDLVVKISWVKEISKEKRKEIIDSISSRAKRQKEVLLLLYEKGPLSYNYIKKKLKIQNLSSVVDRLIEKGYIEFLDKELKEVPCPWKEDRPSIDIEPVNMEFSESFGVYVLNDLSFPEKVQFYMMAYEKFKEKGSVLFLFPNQKIMEHTLEKFVESGYGGRVFPYHSGLKKKEERGVWACIREGKKAGFFALSKGPFLPISNLSLIIMDEEGSLEYMTKTDPVYHLRKVALERAKHENIPIILESPKPSLFSYKGLISDDYKKIVFKKDKKRRSKILPNVIIAEKTSKKGEDLPSWLTYRMEYAYSQKKKIFLFVNKRGYSYLVCKDCGHIFKCPDCDIPLIYFAEKGEFSCPKCTYKEKVPDICPSCGGFNLVPWSSGVEKIREIVKGLLPDARIVLISSDKRPDSFLKREDYDVIIGTSASFGYFNFLDIDLIGVLSIDTMLSSGTYHAAEDVFLLLNFLRINMKKTGEIIIETRYPEHRVFTAFLKDDAGSFYRKEILFRKELFYPPFSNMIKFIVGAKISEEAEKKLITFKDFLKEALSYKGEFFLDVSGPYLAYKERGYYFWELVFKIEKYDICAPIFKGAYQYFFKKELNQEFKVKVQIDPDII